MASRKGLSARVGRHNLAALGKTLILRKRIPLFLSWNITFRCNLRCKYCGSYDVQRPELDTPEVLEGLDGLWDLGARWITFGGGEPLVRNDITEILRHAKQKGFQVFLSTNGWLLRENAAVLKWVDNVNLSLDGGREVHDEVRGEGAFDKTIEGITICEEAGVPASLQCVLSSYNLDSIGDVLDTASAHGLRAMFQPATKWLDSSTEPNPIAPPVEPYRKAMARLIDLKKQGAPIANSVGGLRHLAKWPDPAPIWCSAGIVTCTVEADGTMLACHQCQVGQFLRADSAKGALKDQFENMPLPKNCTQCWCAPLVELGLIFSLRPEPIMNAVRRFV